MVGGATVTRTRRLLPRKAAATADMIFVSNCRVGPRNFTPSPSQIPYVNLPIHTARVIACRLPPSPARTLLRDRNGIAQLRRIDSNERTVLRRAAEQWSVGDASQVSSATVGRVCQRQKGRGNLRGGAQGVATSAKAGEHQVQQQLAMPALR